PGGRSWQTGWVGRGEAEGVDFFISHAGPDAEWAAWAGAQLIDAGYTVELDAWDWSAGFNFVLAMERALERARRMIAVLTPTYFSRAWTGVERHAVSRPAPGKTVPYPGERAIFPAGLPTVRDLPARNLSFTGRTRLLADLARRLREDSG